MVLDAMVVDISPAHGKMAPVMVIQQDRLALPYQYDANPRSQSRVLRIALYTQVNGYKTTPQVFIYAWLEVVTVQHGVH